MSTSAISSLSSTTALTVLASAASTAAQMQSKIEIDQINAQIQKQLAAKTAAIENAPDGALVSALQSHLTALQQQASAATTIGSRFGANANVLSDLQNQLGAMQTAAAGSDAAGFDTALQGANIDVADLLVISPTAPYQPDQIDTLKLTGLGIGDSASYDLSSPAGQAAAAADVQTAQDLVGLIFQATTSNQLIAGSVGTALTTQVTALTSQLSDLQQTNQSDALTKIQQLTQQAQNQSHLIELALGNTQILSTALSQAVNPPQPYTTPFDALEQSTIATPASGTTQQIAPAVLSLLS